MPVGFDLLDIIVGDMRYGVYGNEAYVWSSFSNNGLCGYDAFLETAV